MLDTSESVFLDSSVEKFFQSQVQPIAGLFDLWRRFLLFSFSRAQQLRNNNTPHTAGSQIKVISQPVLSDSFPSVLIDGRRLD